MPARRPSQPPAWDADGGEIGALLREGLGVDEFDIERHPLSGRNRLCVAKLPDGRRFFIKQSSGAGRGESHAQEIIGRTDFTIAPILASPSGRTAIYEYLGDAANLEEIAARDLSSALRALLELGFRSMYFYSIDPPEGLPQASPLVDFPCPSPGQVLDSSEGFRQVLIEAQGRGLLERAACREAVPLRISHGDLKLDNILLLSGRPVLVDFELCCLAPAGSDTACYVALMFVACMRAGMFQQEGEMLRTGFAIPIRMAAGLVGAFNAYSTIHPLGAPSAGEFDRMVARHLIERALTEAAPRREMLASDTLLLDLADLLLARGLQSLCDVLSPPE